ncbi:MAG: YihY/virulence factor BrkB family protein [Candidatus Magasanikbacteria bacterium]
MEVYKKIFKQSLFNLYSDGAISYSAAISFYVILALPAFLLIVVSLGGLILDKPTVQQQILFAISDFSGLKDVTIIENLLNNAFNFNARITTVYSIILLIITSGAIFTQLQQSLNSIYEIKIIHDSLIQNFLLRRTFAFLMLVGLGLLFIVNLIIQGILSIGIGYIEPYIYFSGSVFLGISTGIGLIVLFIIFLLVFKIVPDLKFAWKDAAMGALVTTILFAVGNNIISWYVSGNTLTTAYGAAGSLVVLLLWIYYSSLILFFGAEFTEYYAIELGEGIEPKENARFRLEKSNVHGFFGGIYKMIKKWYKNK